jgi:hypothetical protein
MQELSKWFESLQAASSSRYTLGNKTVEVLCFLEQFSPSWHLSFSILHLLEI